MYDDFSLVYDRFVNWQSRLAYEMPFIEKQLKTLRKRPASVHILDAACGTGMHVVELNQRGYHASGADSSRSMILRAIENAAVFDVRAAFKTAGFGELQRTFVKGSEDPSFDAVLCLGNSIPHILTREKLNIALADFKACLKPSGFLLLQNRNFDVVAREQQRWMEPQSYRGEDGEWIFLRFYDFEPDGLINFNILTLHRKDTPVWEQSIRTTRLYPWQSSDLVAALQDAGFDKITRFGDMEGAPYDPDTSGNLVIRAEADQKHQ